MNAARSLAIEQIGQRIYILRSQRVMLDSDLAQLYGVPTKRLNEQVRRNAGRFPNDFMFQLTMEEAVNLKSQFATSSSRWGGRRKLPRAFTQEGVAMLSSVLHSRRAVGVNIAIMRTFVRLREVLATNADLAHKLSELEGCVASHDANIRELFRAIRKLMQPARKPRPMIGFRQGAA